jgi:hypothetical protein
MEVLSKIKNIIRNIGHREEMRTRDLENNKQEYQPHDSNVSGKYGRKDFRFESR